MELIGRAQILTEATAMIDGLCRNEKTHEDAANWAVKFILGPHADDYNVLLGEEMWNVLDEICALDLRYGGPVGDYLYDLDYVPQWRARIEKGVNLGRTRMEPD